MPVRIAINGFGRIGRLVARSILESSDNKIELVAINSLSDTKQNAYLLKYDSIHGIFGKKVTPNEEESCLIVDDHKIYCTKERDPKKLPWKNLAIDIVYECTGAFDTKEKAMDHIHAGAAKVLISAPGKNADATIVFGVNHHILKPEHKIVSCASCTTNCLAPIAYIIDKKFQIEKGFCSTVHAYTRDQSIIDQAHTNNRRGRAAGISMIPTSTGAAKALGLVLPHLKGKVDGAAIRVPTANVSLIDCNFTLKKKTSKEDVNASIIHAANNDLLNILTVCNEELVSVDFNHNPSSAIFDLTQTQVIEENFLHILAWYDNEWGFANRMNDVALEMVSA